MLLEQRWNSLAKNGSNLKLENVKTMSMISQSSDIPLGKASVEITILLLMEEPHEPIAFTRFELANESTNELDECLVRSHSLQPRSGS